MKKRTKLAIALLGLLFIMYITTPNMEDVYDWLASEHDIKPFDESMYPGSSGLFEKGDSQVQEISSHFRHMGFLTSVEKTFRDKTGGYFTIRTLGLFNQLIPMEDGLLWDWLN